MKMDLFFEDTVYMALEPPLLVGTRLANVDDIRDNDTRSLLGKTGDFEPTPYMSDEK